MWVRCAELHPARKIKKLRRTKVFFMMKPSLSRKLKNQNSKIQFPIRPVCRPFFQPRTLDFLTNLRAFLKVPAVRLVTDSNEDSRWHTSGRTLCANAPCIGFRRGLPGAAGATEWPGLLCGAGRAVHTF